MQLSPQPHQLCLRLQESICNEVSALLTVMEVQHSTGQDLAQGALTIDVFISSQQVQPSSYFRIESARNVVDAQWSMCSGQGHGSQKHRHKHDVVTPSRLPGGHPARWAGAVLQQPAAPAAG